MSKKKGQKQVPEILKMPMLLYKDELMGQILGDFERQPLLWGQLVDRFRAAAEFYGIDPEQFRGRSADGETELFEYFHELSSRVSFDLPGWVSPRSVHDRVGFEAQTWQGQMMLACSLCGERFPDGFRFIAEGKRASPQGRRREWTVRQRLDLVCTVDRSRSEGMPLNTALGFYKCLNNMYSESKIICDDGSLRSRYHEFKRWQEKGKWTTAEFLELCELYLETLPETGCTEKND